MNDSLEIEFIGKTEENVIRKVKGVQLNFSSGGCSHFTYIPQPPLCYPFFTYSFFWMEDVYPLPLYNDDFINVLCDVLTVIMRNKDENIKKYILLILLILILILHTPHTHILILL